MGLVRFIKNQLRHDRNMKQALGNQYEELLLTRMLLVEQMSRSLTEKTLNCSQMGITEDRLCDHEVVVSLTSFGKRIYDVPVVIESIMRERSSLTRLSCGSRKRSSRESLCQKPSRCKKRGACRWSFAKTYAPTRN